MVHIRLDTRKGHGMIDDWFFFLKFLNCGIFPYWVEWGDYVIPIVTPSLFIKHIRHEIVKVFFFCRCREKYNIICPRKFNWQNLWKMNQWIVLQKFILLCVMTWPIFIGFSMKCREITIILWAGLWEFWGRHTKSGSGNDPINSFYGKPIWDQIWQS